MNCSLEESQQGSASRARLPLTPHTPLLQHAGALSPQRYKDAPHRQPESTPNWKVQLDLQVPDSLSGEGAAQGDHSASSFLNLQIDFFL